METTRENYDALLEEVMREIPPKPEQRQPMDKETWAAAQKAQREELYALADQVAGRALSDPAALRQFIETQARLGGESAANTLILMERYPKAARVHTFEEWKHIKALLTDTPVPVCLSEEVPATVGAVYLPEQGMVNVARGLEGKALFFSAARELARESGCQSTFLCDCVANILCSRYHMEPRYPDRIPETYANLEPKAKRAVLADIRQVAWLIERRMDRNLDRLVNPREKQQDTPER